MTLYITPPRTVVNSNTSGHYSYLNTVPASRPGADDMQDKPSRIGNQLHFRNGRVTDLNGKPIKPTKTTP